jgi:glutathione S-transferase
MVEKGPIAAVQFYDASDSCPFAAKAWLTLLEKGITFERQTIDLKNKPKYFSDLYASINPDPAARAKVPLLIGSARIRGIVSSSAKIRMGPPA